MKFTKPWLMRMKDLVDVKYNSALPIADFRGIQMPKDKPKRAAIFIPLCNRNGVASILFTLRTNTVGSHKGQVSFPGGHVDPGETDEQAAFREVFEELGTDIGPIHTIAMCETIPAKNGMPVTPVLGFIERDVEDFAHFNPSVGEVERIFTRSLDTLSNQDYKTYEMLTSDMSKKQYRMPSYGGGETGSKEAEERIWGLTAFVLESILDRVVEPTKAGQQTPPV